MRYIRFARGSFIRQSDIPNHCRKVIAGLGSWETRLAWAHGLLGFETRLSWDGMGSWFWAGLLSYSVELPGWAGQSSCRRIDGLIPRRCHC